MKIQQLVEVSMSPSALRAFAQTPQAQSARVGFEAELAVPVPYNINTQIEPDYSEDTSAESFEEIVQFFRSGDNPISRSEARDLLDKLQEGYQEFVNEVIQNRMNLESDQAIARMARQDGMDDDAVEQMLVDKTGDYDDYFDQVMDQFTEQAYDAYDEQDYLRSVGLHRMSDVESEFNLTWPFWQQGEGDVDAAIQEIAQHIQDSLQVQVLASSTYHTAPRQPGSWVLEPDSSISSPEGYAGLELITPSPPMQLPQSLEAMTQVFAWAKSYGCITNKSTGFHISVSVPGQERLDWIKLVLLLGDQHVLDQFGRSANTYARSALDLFLNHLTTKPNWNSADAMDALRRGMMGMAADVIGVPSTGKYVSVHVKPHFVEFRSAGGDYLDNLEQMELTMLRYVRAMVLASDENAEKQEYARKLYKVLTRYGVPKPQDHVIDLFSLYHSGNIDKAALILSLKRYRQQLATQQKDQ